jgi:hypothetical protein
MVKELIATIRNQVPMEIRSAAPSGEFLEAVVQQQDLAGCVALLRQRLGEPVKDFGEAAAFDGATLRAVHALGGIQADQCLFLSEHEPTVFVYGALWPWASDPARLTVRIGMCRVPS